MRKNGGIKMNENIKSMSLVLIDDIKDVLADIKEDEVTVEEGMEEVERLLNTLKKGVEKIP